MQHAGLRLRHPPGRLSWSGRSPRSRLAAAPRRHGNTGTRGDHAGCQSQRRTCDANSHDHGHRATAHRRSGGARALGLVKPPIVWDPIPFGPERKAQMTAYVRRHYGSLMKPTWRLVRPHVIVIHFTGSPDFQSTYIQHVRS